ncbi:ABC transporter permease, partial [Promineifilum sp.]|uniref:ABC transporter permease n=1 Tax=Promineifilum sp. TaxID=2664178 RepID=UPI0035AED046
GVPPTTAIAAFDNRAGRRLSAGNGAGGTGGFQTRPYEVYINYETEKLTHRPAVGDELALKLNGDRERETQLIGISLRPFEAGAYMAYADFEQATGVRGRAGRLVVYLDGDDPARQTAVAAELVARYEAAGMTIQRVETAGSLREGFRAQFNNLVLLLMALAGLTALVGGLGLANTMALNVLERSREIGILRSMGAGRSLLRRLILAEGLAIALISAFFAVLLALPLTAVLDRVMGNSLLGSPLSFAFAPAAAAAWLGLVVVIGVVACWLPAERAGRMTVREALAYE